FHLVVRRRRRLAAVPRRVFRRALGVRIGQAGQLAFRVIPLPIHRVALRVRRHPIVFGPRHQLNFHLSPQRNQCVAHANKSVSTQIASPSATRLTRDCTPTAASTNEINASSKSTSRNVITIGIPLRKRRADRLSPPLTPKCG